MSFTSMRGLLDHPTPRPITLGARKRLQGALGNAEKCWKWSREVKEGEVRAKEMKRCKMERMRGLLRKEETGPVQGRPPSAFVLAKYKRTATCPPYCGQDREMDTSGHRHKDTGTTHLGQQKGGKIQVLGVRALCQCRCAKIINPNPNEPGTRVTFKIMLRDLQELGSIEKGSKHAINTL